MKYLETYVQLNWAALGEQGLTRPNNSHIVISPTGCSFFKEVSCAYSSAMIIYMASHHEVSMFSALEIFQHFFFDNRANSFIFDEVFDKLFAANLLKEVP